MTKVTLIPGDGIGTEITQSVKKLFKAAGVNIEWEEINAGQTAFEHTGELIPRALIESVERNKVALKGPIGTPIGKGFKSVNVQLRQIFDLYSNVRPCKTTPGVKTRYDNIDLVIFRENTEGLYSGLEFYDSRLEISDTISRVTRVGCERLVKAAFEYARATGRKKITLAHKANILKSNGGLFIRSAEKIAREYPDIKLEDKIIDNMCMQLVVRPEQFDVIATTNLFGDILSDLCAGLVGGLGVVAGANIGENAAIFEAVHGTAPDIAGKGIANPTAMIRSAVMMLEHLNMREEARRIAAAVDATLATPEKCTGDLGGKATTMEFTDNLIANIK